MKFHKIDQRTPQWKTLRLGIPTASDFHRIFTAVEQKKSKSYDDYLNKKIAEWWFGEEDPDETFQNRYMQNGIDSESEAVAAYEFLTDIQTYPGGFFTDDPGLIGASPDRIVRGEDGLVEIKTHKNSVQVGCARFGAELDHAPQLQGQLWICEREWVDVYAYNPGLKLKPKRIYRDEKYIKNIARSLRDFIEEMFLVRADFEREYAPRPSAEKEVVPW